MDTFQNKIISFYNDFKLYIYIYIHLFEANKVRGKCNITLISLFLKHYIWLMLLIMWL